MVLIHKDNKTKTPFTFMTFDEEDIDKLINNFVLINDAKLVCKYCNEKIKKSDIGGIVPGKTEIFILCKSPMCLIEYMEDYLIDIKGE